MVEKMGHIRVHGGTVLKAVRFVSASKISPLFLEWKGRFEDRYGIVLKRTCPIWRNHDCSLREVYLGRQLSIKWWKLKNLS